MFHYTIGVPLSGNSSVLGRSRSSPSSPVSTPNVGLQVEEPHHPYSTRSTSPSVPYLHGNSSSDLAAPLSRSSVRLKRHSDDECEGVPSSKRPKLAEVTFPGNSELRAKFDEYLSSKELANSQNMTAKASFADGEGTPSSSLLSDTSRASTSRCSDSVGYDADGPMDESSADSSKAPENETVPVTKFRGHFPETATRRLKSWLFSHKSHPYPTEDEKSELSAATGLNRHQITNWFTNARRRLLPREDD